MFGNQNNQQQTQDENHIPEQSIEGVVNSGEQADQPSGVPAASPGGGDTWQHPGAPLSTSSSSPASPITPAYPADNPTLPAAPPSAPAIDPVAAAAATDDLIDIKQQALSQLSPLVGHLDQTPEEKFRTTMMMIQATDDQSKVKDAYAAAQQITDEKVRAQALLDIVNEINYFTQHHHAPQPQPET